LVPLASYLWLRGRCGRCGAPIGRFHLAVEIAAVAVAAWAVLAAAEPQHALANALLGWVLLALAGIDADHLRLPDVLTLPLIVAGLVATWLLEPWVLTEHAVGAIAGYLLFRLLAAAFRRWRGYDGLGIGDAKLLAAGGAWVGLGALPMVISIAALAGIGWITLRHGDRHRAIPFGPFLALGIWLMRLHGNLMLP
ncbi:MAG: prepilin peptidase, partial [Proteobacteria bacterium]